MLYVVDLVAGTAAVFLFGFVDLITDFSVVGLASVVLDVVVLSSVPAVDFDVYFGVFVIFVGWAG